MPVVVVGGGSVLLGDELPGASRAACGPTHFAVANAIGAAIAQVGGEIDRIYAIDARTPRRGPRRGDARRRDRRATRPAPSPDAVRIVDIDEVPLAYLPGNATRIRVQGGRRPRARGGAAVTRHASLGADLATSPAARPSSAPAAGATRTSAV